MGNKFAGYIKEWIPFDMTFILLGGIGFGAPHFPDLDESRFNIKGQGAGFIIRSLNLI